MQPILDVSIPHPAKKTMRSETPIPFNWPVTNQQLSGYSISCYQPFPCACGFDRYVHDFMSFHVEATLRIGFYIREIPTRNLQTSS